MDSVGYALASMLADNVMGIWSTKTNASIAFATNGNSCRQAVDYNGKVYILYVQTMYVYDPATDTWEQKSGTAPFGAAEGAAARIGNKIYYFKDTNCAEYNIDTNTWESKAAIPTTTYRNVAAAYNNYIYLFAGITTVTQKYDANSNTWITSPVLPAYPIVNCYSPGLFVIDTKAYINGGGGSAGCKTMYAFDFTTETYTQMADMLDTRRYHPSVVIGNYGYTFNGDTSTAATKNVERYVPNLNSWLRMSNMPYARWGMLACAINEQIFTIGGCDISGAGQKTVAVYDLLRPEFKNLLGWLAAR